MKKVVKVTYACGICSEESDTRQKALECEKIGVALPEFKRFEIVELTGLKGAGEAITVSGFKVDIKNGTRIVIQDNAKEAWSSSHYLPSRYDVRVYTPGRKICDRPIFTDIVSGVERECLKKVHVCRNGRCYLCDHTDLTITYESAYCYLDLGRNLPFLKVEVQKCSKCGVEFFTTAQSRNVDALVRQKCRWPIANTRNLVKRESFGY